MATEEPVAKTEEPKTEEKVRAEPARLSLAGWPLRDAAVAAELRLAQELL